MDDPLEKLQEKIDAETRAIYTDTVIDHAMNPRNVGVLPGAEGWARYKGPCGDTMEIWLKMEGNRVARANFWTDGCGTAIACGSMVTELAKGRNVHYCLEMEQKDVLDSLGDLPEESRHCALLAATTLKMAAEDYLSRRGGEKKGGG